MSMTSSQTHGRARRGEDAGGRRPVLVVGFLAGGCVALALAAAFSPRAATAQEAAAPPFTDEQAAEGADSYARHCASCHGADLDGTLAPPLVGEAYRANWYGGDRTVGDLFITTVDFMPLTDPGSLALEEYAAIMAFLLARNGHAATGEPFPTDAEALDAIPLVVPEGAHGRNGGHGKPHAHRKEHRR